MFLYALLAVAFSLLISLIVYTSGGTRFSYLHLMYLPILFAGVTLRIWGGLASAFFAGILLGPVMPENVALQIYQATPVWLLRMLFFMLIGFSAGSAGHFFRAYLKEIENRLKINPLTGLPNVFGVEEKIEKRRENNQTQKNLSGAIAVQFKRLRDIERAIGPKGIDRLVQEFAKRIVHFSTSDDLVCHADSVTFVVCLFGQKNPEEEVERLRQGIGHIFDVDHIPIFAEIYYGLVRAQGEDESAESLIRRAKVAVNRAMTSGCEKAWFDKQDDEKIKRNVQIIHDLQLAIKEDQLTLYYQPKVNLKTGNIEGAEALVRWPHPKYGMVPPSDFIPLIENTLLINPFTKWLLDKSMKQLKEWLDKDLDLLLSVNFSMKNFLDPSVLDHLRELMKIYQIPKSVFEIEVTETSVAENIMIVGDILQNLRSMGIKIAVDDYGTGQSSLQYLFELPLDTIKIDRVFIDAMLRNSAAEAIVRSTIHLAQELNLSVVAEGIETEAQFQKLNALGCDQAQGYYIAKPMPAELTTEWIISKKGKNNPRSKSRV